jgi:hypothetical protein
MKIILNINRDRKISYHPYQQQNCTKVLYCNADKIEEIKIEPIFYPLGF